MVLESYFVKPKPLVLLWSSKNDLLKVTQQMSVRSVSVSSYPHNLSLQILLTEQKSVQPEPRDMLPTPSESSALSSGSSKVNPGHCP